MAIAQYDKDKAEQRIHIIEEIKELINSEKCPINKETGEKNLSEIAVLTAKNDELSEYAQLLYANNIPYDIKKGKNNGRIV